MKIKLFEDLEKNAFKKESSQGPVKKYIKTFIRHNSASDKSLTAVDKFAKVVVHACKDKGYTGIAIYMDNDEVTNCHFKNGIEKYDDLKEVFRISSISEKGLYEDMDL